VFTVKCQVLLPLSALAVMLCARSANALPQSKHRDLSEKACYDAHLPSDFCKNVGAASWMVDHNEWDTLAAHAQPEAGQTRCQGASSTLLRVHDLGAETGSLIATWPAGGGTEALSTSLGRVLHTLQDNCAHSGIPNPHHAWLSLSDTCEGTSISPDIQPEALSCAAQESALAIHAFVEALTARGLSPATLGGLGDPGPTFFPPRDGACDFMKSAKSWDGVDQRWDNGLVRPALRDELVRTLVLQSTTPPSDLCAAGPDAIDAKPVAPATDVTTPPMWCGAVSLYCLGKGDGADEAPPWESTSPAASSSGSQAEGGGCATRGLAREGGGLALLGCWVALALLGVRRGRLGRERG